jgi:hypothetical protein
MAWVKALFLLQLLDTVSTACWCGFGGIPEANPAMAVLLEQGIVWFVLVKVAVAALSYVLLQKAINDAVALAMVKVVVVLYACIGVWHIVGSLLLIGGML